MVMRGRSSKSNYVCQADGCGIDLVEGGSFYYKRHKVCVPHANSSVVYVNNVEKRFCQQCSKLHEIVRFEGTKKSCKESLACHNARRRKTHAARRQQARAQAAVQLQQPPPPQVFNCMLRDQNAPRFSMAKHFFDLNQLLLQNNFASATSSNMMLAAAASATAMNIPHSTNVPPDMFPAETISRHFGNTIHYP